MADHSIFVAGRGQDASEAKPAGAIDLSGIPPELIQELLFGSDRLKLIRESRRPLAEHLRDYRNYMEAKSVGPRHLRDATRRLRVMARLCRATTFADLNPLVIRQALRKLAHPRERRKTLGPATINHYLHSMKSFANWMTGEGARAERSPCAGIRPLNTRVNLRHCRRSLSAGEVIALLNAANTGPTIAGIPGAERALGYLLAATTGLRSNELQTLTRESFRLEGAEPHIRVKAAYTKNKRPAHIFLRADVAEMMRSYLAQLDRPTTPAAGAGILRRSKNPMRAMRLDLASAGIPYEIDGEYADFHALRHTFVTSLFAAGTTPKTAQALARHQDPRLTLGRYAHVSESDQRTAIERLPAMGLDRITITHAATDCRA